MSLLTLIKVGQLLNRIADYERLITVSLLAAITTLSLIPLPELPPFPGNDKTHHLLAYSVLAFPMALRGKPLWLLAMLLIILWSGGIELVQPLVNRYGEWLDLLANSVGVILGAFIGVIARRSLTSGRISN